jgi:hypothetical protein
MPTYHVDTVLGDDKKPGTDRTKAWRTLGRVSQQAFEPGDTILLKRNCVWEEPLRLKGKGTKDQPIRISAYGEGPQPRIVVKDSDGISADGPISGWHINSLEVAGADTYSPRDKKSGKVHGIHFTQSDPCDDLRITECLVHDVPGAGIACYTTGDPRPVFTDLVIEDCRVFNAGIGISTCAGPTYGPEYFPNFRVARCTTHDIGTDGIIPFCGTDGVIDHCTAFRTGIGITKRSPVGIWYAWATRCVIQFCESYDNHTAGNTADGGGFDIDGGCTDCIMQYNYSHDNDGAGYLICSWDTEKYPIKGIICRYNLSLNDGLANDYGSIHFWQAWDSHVYNNTCVARQASPVKFMTSSRNITLANNIFFVDSSEDRAIIKSDHDIRTSTFRNNLYFRNNGGVRFELPEGELASFESFVKHVGSEGEKSEDPLFAALKFDDINLKAASPCLGAGLKLPDMGGRDYAGNELKDNAPVHIGCSPQTTRLIPRPPKKK